MPKTNEEAKTLIESLLPLQESPIGDYVFPCPRCGHDRMNPVAVRNSLSRRANVYICAQCGMDEAMLDMAGKPPLPLNQWSMAISFGEDGDENEDDYADE